MLCYVNKYLHANWKLGMEEGMNHQWHILQYSREDGNNCNEYRIAMPYVYTAWKEHRVMRYLWNICSPLSMLQTLYLLP